METKTFSYPLIIREHYLDTFGHVNNAAYLEIFEEARWDLVSNNGYGLEHITRVKKGPVILEVKLKFLKELKARMNVNVKTRLISYKGKISVMRQWMEDANGAVLSEAEFTFGLFDLAERKLIPPTEEWLTAIGMNPSDFRSPADSTQRSRRDRS